ncbi:MAG: helix-turn-helix domain-containing protein [bacterium]|nr:helix-turn-helix domain-containing protein [bacterium]
MTKTNNALQMSLKEFGFSEKEIQVYLALLELGKGTVSAIARKAGIQRTTCYTILDSLVGKKLAMVSGKEPKQEYVAESPDMIVEMLKQEVSSSQEQLKNAEKLVPQLKSIHNIGNRPKVKFYEGKEGLKEVYEDTLTSHEEIRAYATLDDMYQALPGYFPDYFKRRAKKNIPIRAILPATQAALERMEYNKGEMRTMALIPVDKFRFSPEINIYDNKVMIASWKEKLGIIIESEEIADAMKKIFELSWQEAERLDKKSAIKN